MGGPLPCRIYSICHHCTKLREVITRDLLPSSTMVKDLSQELGLPISRDDLTDGKVMVLPSQPAPCLERFLSRKSTLAYEIQAHRDKYLQGRNTMVLTDKGREPSLIQVGALSSPGQGSQALAPRGAVQSPAGRYRLDNGCLYLLSWDPGPGGREDRPRGWAGSEARTPSPQGPVLPASEKNALYLGPRVHLEGRTGVCVCLVC